MRTPTLESPVVEWIGQYAVANSAGLINVEDCRYLTRSAAHDNARIASMGGRHGACWAVRLTGSPAETAEARKARSRRKRAQRDVCCNLVADALKRWPEGEIRAEELVDWFNDEFRPIAELAVQEV